MLLPSRYCSQAECKDVLLLCLPQRENEAFSETASFRVDRLLHFFSGSLGSDAANEWLELRGFLPLGSFSWVHYLFSQPKNGKENNLWDRDGSWLVMAKDSFPPQLLIGSAVFLGCFLKVGKEATIPFLFICLPRGCRSVRKDGDKSGDFPPPHGSSSLLLLLLPHLHIWLLGDFYSQHENCNVFQCMNAALHLFTQWNSPEIYCTK